MACKIWRRAHKEIYIIDMFYGGGSHTIVDRNSPQRAKKSPYFGFLINEFERMGSGFKNSPFLSQTTNFMLIKKLWDLFDFKTSKL